jgi:exonuclease III
MYQAKGPWKQAGVAILISEKKIDFKYTLVKQDKEVHFILIKMAIHQQEIPVINLYAPNGNVPNFMKHTLKKIKHISNTIVVGDLIPLYHQ